MNRRELLRKIDRLAGRYICLAAWAVGKVLGGLSLATRPSAERGRCEFANVLLMKLVGKGDMVLILSTVRALREQHPDARLSMLVTPLSSGVLTAGVDVDDVILYDVLGRDAGLTGFIRLVAALRERRFDLIIDYEQHLNLVALLSYLVGARERVGFVSGDGRRGLLLTRPVLLNDKVHMAEAFADLVRSLELACDVSCLAEVYVPQEDEALVDGWLRERRIFPGGVMVAIHPGSGGSALGRRWPAERFAELADRVAQKYGARVLLTGTRDELWLIERVVGVMETEPVVAAGELSFRQVAALLKRCSLAVSNDTGLVHLAAAMGAPVVALFGPNLPLRYRPIGEGHAVLYKGLECSPCINIHRGRTKTCEVPLCMHSISVDEVWEAVQVRLDALCQARGPSPSPRRFGDRERAPRGAAGMGGITCSNS